MDKLPDSIRSEELQAGVRARNEAIKAAKRERIRSAKEAKDRGRFDVSTSSAGELSTSGHQVVIPVTSEEEEQVLQVVAQAVMGADRQQHTHQSMEVNSHHHHHQTVLQDNFVVQVEEVGGHQGMQQHLVDAAGSSSHQDLQVVHVIQQDVVGHHEQVGGHHSQVVGHHWQQVWPTTTSSHHDGVSSVTSQDVTVEGVHGVMQVQHVAESDAANTLYNMTQR